MERNILVMAKQPVPGKVKTRLQPFLSPIQSAELATAMLRDTLELCESFDAELTVAFSPVQSSEYFRDICGSETNLIPQTSGDLGARMSSAFENSRVPSVMIGTDCPSVSQQDIDEAFEKLDTGAEMVLGPSTDGGYYLIGFSRFDKRVFEAVEWSSACTLEHTVSNAKKFGLVTGFLKERRDVDHAEDLEALNRIDRNTIGRNVGSWLDENSQLFQT